MIFRELRADAMNTEIEDPREEQKLLADFDAETNRILAESSRVIAIMRTKGEQEARAANGGHAKGGRSSAAKQRPSGWQALQALKGGTA